MVPTLRLTTVSATSFSIMVGPQTTTTVMLMSQYYPMNGLGNLRKRPTSILSVNFILANGYIASLGLT